MPERKTRFYRIIPFDTGVPMGVLLVESAMRSRLKDQMCGNVQRPYYYPEVTRIVKEGVVIDFMTRQVISKVASTSEEA